MDGIRIPADVAEEAGVPDDLDSGRLGPYRFPSPDRRRIGARVYLAAGLLAVFGALANLGAGLWVVAIGLLALAYVHYSTAWPLAIGQERALDMAAALTPFPVGHASAALGFVGGRSRPVWNLVLYSAENPPRFRALVRIDAVSGRRIDEVYTEQLEQPA
ncbi:MAG: hypothetical protein F4X18_04815 [Acidimicrobiia bacterium]|nr:hypothetical protein [Acidimicrobiia bacterium]MYC84829.1 hypothetical protein [Acidimicrobiia bacterium]